MTTKLNLNGCHINESHIKLGEKFISKALPIQNLVMFHHIAMNNCRRDYLSGLSFISIKGKGKKYTLQNSRLTWKIGRLLAYDPLKNTSYYFQKPQSIQLLFMNGRGKLNRGTLSEDYC